MSKPASLKRIVILISGSGTNMVNIVEHCQANKITGQVVAVISNTATAQGLNKAQALGIHTECLSHKSYDSRESYDLALAKLVAQFKPDVVVLAGFMRVLSAVFINSFAGKILNIHPSLLPKYKGLNTHQRALENGDLEHGVTVHFVDETLDGGPVILQAKVPVFKGDSVDDLQARVHHQEYKIYPLVIQWICTERLHLSPAGAVLDNQLLGPYGYAAEDEDESLN